MLVGSGLAINACETLPDQYTMQQLFQLQRALRRELADSLDSIWVGHCDFSFQAERNARDHCMLLGQNGAIPSVAAQRFLPLFEIQNVWNMGAGDDGDEMMNPSCRCVMLGDAPRVEHVVERARVLDS